VGLWDKILNPLNAELNLICHLLALLGAHHIFHVSGLRVKSLKFASPCIIMLQINQPTRCKNFSSLLLDVYVQFNMFRA